MLVSRSTQLWDLDCWDRSMKQRFVMNWSYYNWSTQNNKQYPWYTKGVQLELGFRADLIVMGKV